MYEEYMHAEVDMKKDEKRLLKIIFLTYKHKFLKNHGM